ncbi:hypothetical protein ACHAXR_003945, partial [Thalassiosira sp. AJA248-18]
CTSSEKAISAMEMKRQGGGGGSGSVETESADAAAATTTTMENNEAANEVATKQQTNVTTTTAPTTTTKRNSRIRVCAICTNEPALSKYANASSEDMDIIEQIQELEDMLESGVNHPEDGEQQKKLTLREMKGLERKIEKLQLELKERKDKKKKAAEEEAVAGGGEGGDDDANEEDESEGDQDSVEDDGPGGNRANAKDDNEEEDPFLVATGGKALVGEEYQKMLLAREGQK